MPFTGPRPSGAANTGARVRYRVHPRRYAFSRVFGITVLLASGLVTATCGEDSPTSPSTPAPRSAPTPRSTPEPSNRAPTVTQAIPDRVLSSGRGALHIIKADRHFSDPDNDALSFRGTSSDRSIIDVGINNSELLLGVRGEGVVTVTVTATDPPGASASLTFRVTSVAPQRGEDSPPPADDHGDTERTATQISVPSRTDGDLEQPDDVDVFGFYLSSVGRLHVETIGQTDTAGELRGPYDVRYGDDDSGEFKNFWIEVVNAPSGHYYLDVWGHATGRYELHLTVDYGWTAPPLTGVWWEVTQPPDYFISESEVRCGGDGADRPGPGVYVSWDLYPDAEYFDLHYRRPDRDSSWLDVGSFDGEGVLVDPYREEVCFEHWGFGQPVTVDLRLRAVFYDGSTSDWYTILDIPFPANPFSAVGGQGIRDGDAALSDRTLPRRQ